MLLLVLRVGIGRDIVDRFSFMSWTGSSEVPGNGSVTACVCGDRFLSASRLTLRVSTYINDDTPDETLSQLSLCLVITLHYITLSQPGPPAAANAFSQVWKPFIATHGPSARCCQIHPRVKGPWGAQKNPK